MKIPNQIDLIDRDELVDSVMNHWALNEEEMCLFKDIIFKQTVAAVVKPRFDVELMIGG